MQVPRPSVPGLQGKTSWRARSHRLRGAFPLFQHSRSTKPLFLPGAQRDGAGGASRNGTAQEVRQRHSSPGNGISKSTESSNTMLQSSGSGTPGRVMMANRAAPGNRTGKKGIPGFVGRERELEDLVTFLNKTPASPLVVLGPQNCGKSALVRAVIKTMQKEYEGHLQPIYIDGRMGMFNDPAVLARALQQEGLSLARKFAPKDVTSAQGTAFISKIAANLWAKAASAVWSMTVDPKGNVRLKDTLQLLSTRTEPTMSDVLTAYQIIIAEAIAKKDPSTPPPLFIFDEANILAEWPDDKKMERRALLRFFVLVSKQLNLAHVVLISSDDGFLRWLGQEIGHSRVLTYVVEEFDEPQARALFYTFLARNRLLGDEDAIDDSVWRVVYEVCGGNAGALGQAAMLPLRAGCTTADLRPLWGPIMSSIKAGLNGAPASMTPQNTTNNNAGSSNTQNNNTSGNNSGSSQQNSFTGPQFARAALHLLRQPRCVAPEDEVVRHLGGYGRAGVDGMVAAKLLSRRPPGQGYGQDAHLPSAWDAIITAPSQVHLFCLRSLKPLLEEVAASDRDSSSREQGQAGKQE